MKTAEIRQKFLDFFAQKDHQVVSSGSLIPERDLTLLFTNAGMVQFKDVFLGLEQRSYARAVSSQCCIRAGGKHNDLENVGYTARHHTFFEMLGNFSFGDYFKREAIFYAWEFLTEVLKLPPERLWVTVYQDDDEAADIWLKEIGVDKARFSRCGEEDNFWSMGDTGPCGPCTEIFYDHGPEIEGGPPGSETQDGDRYIELWNLVFMQYNRTSDGSMNPLPSPSVDTGLGLERIAAVLQGVHNNYEIDLFAEIIQVASKITKCKDLSNSSLRVLADHIRSSAFLILDGVLPSNEGRGYVLRRIIRRALRHGYTLGMKDVFFSKLLPPLINTMGDHYPELNKQKKHITQVLLKEEEKFAKTLERGMLLLEQDIASLDGNIISGKTVFKLYDTYGFPVDLTLDIARERNLKVDMEGFNSAMEKQKQLSGSASRFKVNYNKDLKLPYNTVFCGYEKLSNNAELVAIVQENGDKIDELAANVQVGLVLDETPFYAESGGQVGDIGIISKDDLHFEVSDTQSLGNTIVHYGKLTDGSLKVGDKVTASVDSKVRSETLLHHSATHLLHAALKKVIGSHVQQKGSIVTNERTRFDFSHYSALTKAEIIEIENLVNHEISKNSLIATDLMDIEEAKKSGAEALFNEKYSEKVRVLTMGDFSKELCGGTHAKRTGDIGLFKIISESGIASGVRRIEAIVGETALKWVQNQENSLRELNSILRSDSANIVNKLNALLDKNKSLEKELSKLKEKLAHSSGGDIIDNVKSIGDYQVLAMSFNDMEVKSLRLMVDNLKSRLDKAVIVLVAVNGDKINVIAGISKSCIGHVPAPADFIKEICTKSGGRDDMAQGGGLKPVDLDDRLFKIYNMVEQIVNTK